jgi:hypothetical protein
MLYEPKVILAIIGMLIFIIAGIFYFREMEEEKDFYNKDK